MNTGGDPARNGKCDERRSISSITKSEHTTNPGPHVESQVTSVWLATGEVSGFRFNKCQIAEATFPVLQAITPLALKMP